MGQTGYIPYVQDKSGERVSEQVRVLVTPTMEKMILRSAQAIYTSNSSVIRMCVEYSLGDPSAETISIVEALNSALRESEGSDGAGTKEETNVENEDTME